MYFQRFIDQTLQDWTQEADRRPLVLRGARQTGKTAALRRLGESFDLFVELNLERFEDLTLVRGCRSADELLQALRVRANRARFPGLGAAGRTLLFVDEIQEHPEAIRWLRFFYEDHPELFVVAAGSLLEVRLRDEGFSFPVGRVTFRGLRPFTFFEFLGAVGEDVLADELLAALDSEVAPAEALHLRALDRLREYLLVGGMPEAVATWVRDRSPVSVRGVQRDLMQALAEDIQKYGGDRGEVANLETAFDALRHHYGLRFRYENFAPGFRSRTMKDALGKLEAALLIRRVWPTSSFRAPLAIRPRSAPKLLPLDVGLALYSLNADAELIRRQPLSSLFGGRVSEMFVGQQLLARRAGYPGDLYFWVAESSRNNAEIDFLVEGTEQPIPIEVKSGAAGTLKSLHRFLERSGLGFGIRLYGGSWLLESQEVRMSTGPLRYQLLSMPLYLAEHLPLAPPKVRQPQPPAASP